MASYYSVGDPDDSGDDFEDDFDSKTAKVLRKNEREESDSEVEVFGVGSGEASDSDDQSDIALSDVEGQDQDDDMPDARAWGKEKKRYYGADYVDPDYGGFQGKDAHAAEIEEEEARNLQNQLIQQLDDNDFSLDVIFKKLDKEEAKEDTDEIIRTDLSKLSNKQKLQIFQKESPEFFGLVEDFKAKISTAKDYLFPIIRKVRDGTVQPCRAVDFVQTYYHLILNYATNIYMYLLLKGNNKLKNHPIIQRLYQYRQLLAQMEPVFEEVIKPQIELLLAPQSETNDNQELPIKAPTNKKKTLKLLSQLQNANNLKKTRPKSNSDQPNKKIKLDTEKKTKHVTFLQNSSDGDSEVGDIDDTEIDNENEETEENMEQTDEHTKRAITYQIAKNKGLTPHRKKELRNPRVKHKLKFRKALIRRKGAVREPRREIARYSGEISGIKTSVSKSIKLKS